MKIIIDPKEPAIFEHEVFGPAIANAIAYISRKATKETFRGNIKDFDPDAFDQAMEKEYTLKLIKQKAEMVTFSCVYPMDEPETIAFNPVLLVNISRALKTFIGKTTS